LASWAPIEFSAGHQFDPDVGAAFSAGLPLAFIDPVSFVFARMFSKEFVSRDHETGLYANL
jgi:hypothetical protein